MKNLIVVVYRRLEILLLVFSRPFFLTLAANIEEAIGKRLACFISFLPCESLLSLYQLKHFYGILH